MKKLLFTFLAILCLTTSCKDSQKEPEPDNYSGPCVIPGCIGSNIEAIVRGTPEIVKNNGVDRDEWIEFEMDVIFDPDSDPLGGTYAISGVPSGGEALWGTNGGDWYFANDAATQIELGGITRSLTATETSVTLVFEISDSDSRSSSYIGEWTFIWHTK